MPPKGTKTVASNRKARHDYEVLETYEAGMVLRGSEVKSLRNASCQLKDSHVRIERGEPLLIGCHIAPYANASSQGGHEVERVRKLLLHHHEIDEIERRMQGEPLTLIPLAVYFKDGRAKVELGLARGRKQYDKRQAIAKRDAARDAERAIRDRERS
ncbi:MAG TPA: SsrA-binding protein SmpB [Acidimicrobiales bacterium]|jgi:SsrA-binding protein